MLGSNPVTIFLVWLTASLVIATAAVLTAWLVNRWR